MRRKNKRPTGKSVNIQTNKRSDFERYTDCSKAKKSYDYSTNSASPVDIFTHENKSILR